MGFNSAFKGLKLLKTPRNGRLNNLNDPSLPQCVKRYPQSTEICKRKQDSPEYSTKMNQNTL